MTDMTLVDTIIANLCSRIGFDTAFDIDDEIMDELKADLSSIIDAHLAKAVEPGEDKK